MSSERNDEELIGKVAEGDQSAFDKLYQKYSTPIYTYLNRLMLDKDMVDELFQEVFLKVYTKAAQFRPTVSFKSWIYTIATNQYRDYYKALKRRSDRVMSLDTEIEPADHRATHEEITLDRVVLEAVEDAIRALPDQYREIILLKRVHKMTFEEAAEILGVSVRTAKNYAADATKKLRAYLELKGFGDELPPEE